MQKLNRNLTEEENATQCLTQITIEDENELAEREVFPKNNKRANPSTMTTNLP